MFTLLFSIEQDGRTSPLNQNYFNIVKYFLNKLQRKAIFCLMSLILRTALNIHGQLFFSTHEPVFRRLFNLFKMA